MIIKKLLKASMKMVHKMTIFDVSVFKLTVAAAALTIAKLFPVVLSLNIWVYVVVWLGGVIYIMRNIKLK